MFNKHPLPMYTGGGKKYFGNGRYKRVGWIESSGTEYIDTGYKPTSVTEGFTAKFSLTTADDDWNLMNMGGTSTDNYRFGFGGYKTTNFQAGFIMYGASSWGKLITSPAPQLDVVYNVEYNYNSSNAMVLNGSIIASDLTTGSYSYQSNWCIFCQTYQTNHVRFMSGKLYGLIIYSGSNPVRNFIPVLDRQTNKAGLYDLVTKTFYGNAGSGAFTYGD